MSGLLGFHRLGQGPEKVLVLHNWMGTHRSFQPIWNLLDTQRFTYVFPDHRGYGLSRQLLGTYSAEEASADAFRVADSLGWEEFHVLGHSMSGMVVQRMAADAPQRLLSLIALTPVPAHGVALDPASCEMFTSALRDDEPWLSISAMITGKRPGLHWHKSLLADFRNNVDPRAAAGFLRMWSGTDFHTELIGSAVPLLAITGRYDIEPFRLPAIQATMGQWFLNSQVEEFTASGHHPMAEEPVQFVTTMERFLLQNGNN